MMHYLKGNLLKSHCQYLCHQVNCLGKMNSGIAKAIREKWPIVYQRYCDECDTWHAWAYAHFDTEPTNQAVQAMLSANIAQVVPVSDLQSVINLFAQGSYGYDGRRYTSYDAFWMCLHRITEIVPKGGSIGFPDHVGCCRGGANWNVIKTMIEEVLGNDYDIYIYELEN